MDVEKANSYFYATVNDFLSDIKVKDIRKFEAEFLEYTGYSLIEMYLKQIVEVKQ